MSNIKNIFQYIINYWVLPTPAELIAEGLIHAQRTILRHQSAMEYHTSIVLYNVARIKRLEELSAK